MVVCGFIWRKWSYAIGGNIVTRKLSKLSVLLPFSHFWPTFIEIEVLNEKDRSLLSMLYCKSLQKQIFLTFCNDFESHYRMFAYILLRSKTILVLQ